MAKWRVVERNWFVSAEQEKKCSWNLQDKVCQGQHHNMVTSPTQRGASKREIGWMSARLRIRNAREGGRESDALQRVNAFGLLLPSFPDPLSAPSLPHRTSKVTAAARTVVNLLLATPGPKFFLARI